MSAKTLPEYVEELLNQIAKENEFNDYVVKVNQDSPPGDGLTSELLSIIIIENDRNKKLDLICKLSPSSENYRKEVSSDILFEHEASFYSKFMPILGTFQDEKQLSKEDQFLSYPKCYATMIAYDSKRCAIVLEDLRPQRFRLWDKTKPSPIENVRLAMCELGKFHGLSIAMKDQKPNEFSEFKRAKDVFKSNFRIESVHELFDATFRRALGVIKDEGHKTIMQHIKDNFLAYLDDCLDDEPFFGVLSHGIISTLHSIILPIYILIYLLGDFWNNNMLFNFNEEVNIELRVELKERIETQ